MPFDTITGPEHFSDEKLRQKVVIYSYHVEKETLPARITSGAIRVSRASIDRLNIGQFNFTRFASSASALTVFLLFSTYLIIGGTSVTAKAASGGATDPVKGSEIKKTVPANVYFRGTELKSLAALPFDTLPMQAKIIPQSVRRGGFETVYAQAGKKFGVPWQLLAAIHLVETGQSSDTMAASSAGALGPMQFMQGTFDAYRQDGDGDGLKSIYDVHDAIYTAAKMLAANGAGRGNARQAIYNYNHSDQYVANVLGVAEKLGYRP